MPSLEALAVAQLSPKSAIRCPVVIAARDEEARIEQTIRHLFAQRGVEAEFIVVDDRSADRTSEILLHLSVYKERKDIKGVVHCHPPHATAYAITGRVPPNCIIPEMEVFVGSVAVSPYETPGTKKFAETVVPYAKDHNSILLANHGIVCWADTVTHAEWYAEVLETYCMTLLIASQLGAPITFIPDTKTGDLLEIKKKLGLPDARMGMKECALCDLGDEPGAIAIRPGGCSCGNGASPKADDEDLVQAVTDAVMAALKRL